MYAYFLMIHMTNILKTFPRLVPNAYPKNLRLVSVHKTFVELAWDQLECFEQNGMVKDYSVTLNKKIRTYFVRQREEISRTTTITFEFLLPGTMYSIAVAARNAEGVGPYSPKIYVETDSRGVFQCLSFCL